MGKKHEELALAKMEIEYELTKSKIECDELREKVTQLSEDQRISSDMVKLHTDRAGRAEERHAKLVDAFLTNDSQRIEMIIELRKEIAELKNANTKAEADVEGWKLKFRELDSRVFQLERDTAMILEKDPVLRSRIKEKGLGPEGLFPEKMAGDKESVPNGGCLLVAPENIDTTPCKGSTHSPEKTNYGVEEDPHSLGMGCKYKVSVGEQSHFEADDPDKMMAASSAVNEKSRFEEVIDIRDDDEVPMSLESMPLGCVSNTRASEIGLDKKGKFSKKFVEQILALQSGDEKRRMCTYNSLLSQTSKRNHPSSFDANENDEDGVPIAKWKIRKIKDLTDDAKSACVDQCKPVFIRQCGKKAEMNNDCQSLSSSSDSDSSVSGNATSNLFINNLIATLRTNMDNKSLGSNKGEDQVCTVLPFHCQICWITVLHCLRANLRATTKLLSCNLKVTDSSCKNSFLQKCKRERLRTIGLKWPSSDPAHSGSFEHQVFPFIVLHCLVEGWNGMIYPFSITCLV